MKKYLFLVLVTSLVVACRKDEPLEEPKACFGTDKRLYAAGEPVNFLNCSRNFDRVLWDFGNGQSSELVNPSFSWQQKGPHVVWLTVWKGELSSRAGSQVSVADCTFVGFRALFSNWQSGYRDSLLHFSVFSRIGNQVTKQLELEAKGSDLRDSLETGIRIEDAGAEFTIRLVVRSKSGLIDSLETLSYVIPDALSNIPPQRTSLRFMTVDHVFTMIYR